jgi:integrase
MAAVVRALQRASQAAGVNVCAYDCRKHFATRMIAKGTDSALVAELLGHRDTKSLAMLIGYYHEPAIATLRRAVDGEDG